MRRRRTKEEDILLNLKIFKLMDDMVENGEIHTKYLGSVCKERFGIGPNKVTKCINAWSEKNPDIKVFRFGTYYNN